jgi:hypothetical protein
MYIKKFDMAENFLKNTFIHYALSSAAFNLKQVNFRAGKILNKKTQI